MNRTSRPSATRLLMLTVLGFGIAALLWARRGPPSRSSPGGDTNAALRLLAGQLAGLEAQENQVAQTVWAKELLAQGCGQVFESLWDSLNAGSNKLEVLAGFSIRELIPPRLGPVHSYGHGIEVREPIGTGQVFSEESWRTFLQEMQVAGWTIQQLEFRHNRFETDAAQQPGRSTFYCFVHLTNSIQVARAMLEGDLLVDWTLERTAEGLPKPRRIDATRLRLSSRPGGPPLRPFLLEEISPPEKSHFIDPLILYDLDGDGLSEIILAASNLVYRRGPDGQYRAGPLVRGSPGLLFTGIIADFDQNGTADFLGAQFEGLVLFEGSPAGTFDQPGRRVWTATPHLKYAQVLTCGDVDGDGDLDVWLGQYKNPYERGQMPSPYYDANDGNPACLLLNDGQGNFTDGTETAGLAKKRWRRSYSGSLVDLDGDGDLDLLVVSDFAGVDVYANDGRGHFTDMSQPWLGEAHSFGMGHTLADFNRDGRLDFLVTGMHCPTAQRLEHLGLRRPGRPDYEAMRPVMTAGNRLYFGRIHGGFGPEPAGASISHSGWSWGCSAFDFDNDGFPDVYVANGHETRESVREYEPEFWLHDIYVADSQDDLVRSAYFGAKFGRTRAHGHSYGGYEKNRLFLNQRGGGFLEAAHLLGVAVEQDSRNVVTDDLDGDGRVDLLLTTFEVWPARRQTLRVFTNTLEDAGNWIGFRFREEGGGASPVGVRVRLSCGGRTSLRQIVTGDSHRSQHANTVHFGLGASTEVDRVEIRWMNGKQVVLEHPRINTYHPVSQGHAQAGDRPSSAR